MALIVEENFAWGEGGMIGSFPELSSTELMEGRMAKLRKKLEEAEEEKYSLTQENRRLEDELFDTRMQLAKALEIIRQMELDTTVTKQPQTDLTPLKTDEGQKLVARLQEGEILDKDYQPCPSLTGSQRGLLASYMATQLNIPCTWKYFASLWGTTAGTLRSAYNKALDQRAALDFQDKLKYIALS